MKRYPNTVRTAIVLALFGAACGLVALWQPFTYIFLGCMVVALLVLSVRDDRNRER